jgi:hypothetical protein
LRESGVSKPTLVILRPAWEPAIRFLGSILAAACHCFLSDIFIDICIDFVVRSSPLSRVIL